VLIEAAAPQPIALVTRSGDRCVTLNWRAELVSGPLRLLRSERAEGPFIEVASSSMTLRSVADVTVENGRTYYYQLQAGMKPVTTVVSATPRSFKSDEDFLDFLQVTAFDYFWNEANPDNGLIRDRSTTTSPSSIAAVGFGLTGIGIGVERGWVSRTDGAQRTLTTLRTLMHLPQNADPVSSGYKGWFYHFLDMETGLRVWQCELSSIDTALLLAGVLYAGEFFSGESPIERDIRSLARALFGRVDWQWMLNQGDTLTMGWHPESGFIKARWKGYNEASILYLLGLGAQSHARLAPEHWSAWTRTYEWKTSYGYSYVHFPPLFGHQYSACWVDFREVQDDYMRRQGITYFENSRRATLAQRAYAIANPQGHRGYGPNVWGLTASDTPRGYMAHGAPPPENDHGTVVPTAPGGSLPFAPRECLAALRHMYSAYRTKLLCGYGFRDAFHPGEDWWGPDALGIDQGAILLMAENLRTGHVWNVMNRSKAIRSGLERAGFKRAADTLPAAPSPSSP
jgi:hypothetical protein